MRRVLLFLLLLALPSAALAGGCRIVQRVAVVQEIAVVTPVIVTPFVPTVAVFAVPAYGASYAPPAAQAPPYADKIDAILRRLDNIERTRPAPLPPAFPPMPASSGQQPPAAAPMPRADDLDAVRALFTARCASCHESSVAQAKGHSLVLLQGDQLAQLTDTQRLKVLTAIYTGSMPPKNPLADADVSKIVEAFARR